MTEVCTMDTGAIKLSLRLGPSPASAGIARRAVRAALGRSIDTDLGDAAVLCTSELVTNAIVHTARGCELQMSFDRPDGGVRVEVSDSSHDQPHIVPTGDVWRVGGRGLQIVDATSSRWGTHPVAGGKVVWFELGSADDRRQAWCAPGQGAQAIPSKCDPG
jgi:hypothetical protein